jgi:hypothetical protein
VGLLFNPVLPGFVDAHSESFDYLEIIPDREWLDRGMILPQRYSILDKSFAFLRRVREEAVVCRDRILNRQPPADTGHVEQIRRLQTTCLCVAQRSPGFRAPSSRES